MGFIERGACALVVAAGLGSAASAQFAAGSDIGWAGPAEPGTVGDFYQPRYGRSMAAADLTGDGRDEVLVGSWAERKVYVYKGSALMTVIDAPSGAFGFGWSIAAGDDVDGDGREDVVVGAPHYQSNRGIVYVYSGRSVAQGSDAVMWTHAGPQTGCQLGFSVDVLGDLDGDGYAEYGAGCPYLDDAGVDRGGALTWSKGGAYKFQYGTSPGEKFGWRLRGVGDLDLDGTNDYVVSSPWAGGSNRGAIWIYDGPTGAKFQTLIGTEIDGWFGYDIDAAGDVDMDGRADLIIGAPNANGGKGTVFVRNLYANLYQASGTQTNHRYGASVAGVGDVNGDGYADFAFRRQCPTEDDAAPCFGGGTNLTPVVVRGSSNGGFSVYAQLGGVPWPNDDDNPIGTGVSLAGGGDTNGDGIAEVLYSTTVTTEPLFTTTGRVYTFFLDGPFNASYTTPAAPVAVQASDAGERNVTVSWRPFANCLGYRVYRDGAYVAEVPERTSVFVDVPPTSGSFTYEVRAFNGKGTGASASDAGAMGAWGGEVGSVFEVSAMSAIHRAGKVDHGGTIAEGDSPFGVTVGVPAFGTLMIKGVGGGIDVNALGPGGPISPEGDPGPSNIAPANGLSGIVHDQRAGFLCGVFLGASAPSDPPPPTLDFSDDALGDDFTDLYPQLDQVFFVGDGKVGTGWGAPHRFHVPDGATRLFLGVADAPYWNGSPLGFEGNVGAYLVEVKVGAWSQPYGDDLAGSLGAPDVALSGAPFVGTTVDVELRSSSASTALAGVFLGFDDAQAPFFGGTLLVDAVSPVVLALPPGGLDIPWALPSASTAGLERLLQLAVQDPGAPGGVALSRGLRVHPGF